MKIDQSITLDPEESFASVVDRIGVGEEEELRTSRRRESYLGRNARVTTRSDVPLTLNPAMNCTLKADDLKSLPGVNVDTSESDQAILVSTELPEQTQTELPPKLYDLVYQEFVTMHEAGHMMYSDFKRLNEIDEELDDTDSALFMDLMNPLEDGAIEGFLSRSYNIDEERLLSRANIAAGLQFGLQIKEDMIGYSFHDATRTILYDLAAYNSGRYTKILDESNQHHYMEPDDLELLKEKMPEIKSLISDYLSEPSGEKRVNILYEWFLEHYQDIEDECQVDFEEEATKRSQRSSPEDRGQEAQGSEHGYVGDERNRLGSPGELDEQQREVLKNPDKEEIEEALGDGEVPESYAGNIEAKDEEYDQDSSGPSSVEEQLHEEYQREIKREASNASGGSLDELEKLHQAIGATNSRLRTIEVLGEDYDGDMERWRSCEIQGRKLARILREKLRHKRRSHTMRNKRRGKFDSKRMISATQGSPRVFTQEDKKQQLDYEFMFVPDRSGSMSGKISMVEEAVGSLAFALDEVGIESSVIDLEGSTPRVSLPFGFDPKNRSSTLTRGTAGGGTPLAEMVDLARKRMEMQNDDGKKPVMVIITDDQPGDSQAYVNEVDNCNFPVVGISLTAGGSAIGYEEDFSGMFDRHIEVESNDPDDLRRGLKTLVEEIVL